MNTKRTFFNFVIAVTLIALIFPQGAYAQDNEPQQVEGTSPFQESLQQYLAERTATGDPVPVSVVYEYEVAEPIQSMSMQRSALEEQDQTVTITATTTIMFDNPQQAGYDEWPSLDPEGVETEISFDDLYYQKMEEEFPGYWDTYEYGQEPRRETFVETFTMDSPSQEIPLMESNFASTTGPTNILMGFTYAGPSIDYTLKSKVESCFLPEEKPWWWPDDWEWDPCVTVIDIKAGFQLEFAFGLRLPAEVTLTGPDQMQLGTPNKFYAALTPMNWNENQYSLNGVATLGGKEYILKAHYFVGVDLTVMDINVCEAISELSAFSCALTAGIDKFEDFAMPFGADDPFPIDNMDIPVKEIGLSELYKNKTQNKDSLTSGMNDEEKNAYYNFLDKLLSAELGIGLRPEIASTKITAHWNGVTGSDCSGEGDITFTAPNTPVEFDVTGCNKGTGQKADIRLSDFRYYFNKFGIKVDAYLKLKAIGTIEIPLRLDLFKVDLSKWTEDASIHLGKHQQCQLEVGLVNNLPSVSQTCDQIGPSNELTLSIPTVDEISPTSAVTLNGTLGNNGWYRSNVEVTLSAADNLTCNDPVEGIQYRVNGSDWVNYSGPFMLDKEGITAIDFYAIDEAGNIETPQSRSIKIDKTPPILSAERIPQPNSYGWNRTDVTVHFEAVDAVSGVDINTFSPDQTFTLEGAGQSATGTVKDMAGNSASLTVNNINIDKTQPNLTITSPQAGTYANTSSFTTAWNASDVLSGIESENGALDGQSIKKGEVVDLLLISAGSHQFTVTAMDKADNSTQASVSVFVSVDINGLIAAKNKVCELGWVDKAGTCNSLGAKLQAAKDAISRGKNAVAINQLNAFINELEAQKGKAVTNKAYNLLRADALYVISQLKK
jgi:hypothetical protein